MKSLLKFSAATFILFALVGCSGKSIDVKKLTDINVKGYEGYGEVVLDFDSDEAFASIKSKKEDDYEKNFEYLDLVSSIVFEVDNYENLSNGDKVKVVATYDERLAKRLKVKIKGTKLSMKVKDLDEVEVLSLKDQIELIEEGVSPNISVDAVFKGDKSLIDYVSIEILDKKENVSKGWYEEVGSYATGDKVIVKITPYEHAFHPDGIVVLEEEVEFEVKTKSTYPETLKLEQLVGLDDAVQKELKIYTDDLVRKNEAPIRDSKYYQSYFVYDYTVDISDMKKGFYIYERDKVSSNLLSLVYKVSYTGVVLENNMPPNTFMSGDGARELAKIKPGKEYTNDVYYVIRIDNIILEDGVVDFESTSKKVDIYSEYKSLLEAESRAVSSGIVDRAVVVELE